MTPLFLYLLKVNIALVLFYMAYRYGLRKLTFYTLNRFYLLFAIGFSSLYPLINLSGFISQRQAAGSEIIYYLPDLGSVVAESPLQLWHVLTFVFWSGVAVMGVRFLVQFISLARLHLGSRKHAEGIRIIKEKINPFSFFRSIYINPLLHTPMERASIIEHEQVHVREWHTFDILVGELNRIFYWFNPGAWLMMTAIRENLEFTTDRRVLQSGMDAKSYQYSLIKVSEIPYASPLANNFNFSHLKIRITMMDKKPSSELHLVKYLVLIPFVAATTLAFNVSRAELKTPVIEVVKLTGESLAPAADTIPLKIADKGTESFPAPVVTEVKFHTAAETAEKGRKTFDDPDEQIRKNAFSPPVVTEVPFGSESENNTFAPVAAVTPGQLVESSKGATTTFREVIHPNDSSKSTKNIMISCCNLDSASQKQPLYIVDGEQVTDINGIEPDKIASLSILKDEKATSLFGKKAEDGVVLIVTKENAVTTDKVKAETSKPAASTVEEEVEVVNDIPLNVDIHYLINGVEASAEEVKILAPGKIKSVNVLKGKSATDKYGEKGENGVIEINTKDQAD